jgi:hypothetical protein
MLSSRSIAVLQGGGGGGVRRYGGDLSTGGDHRRRAAGGAAMHVCQALLYGVHTCGVQQLPACGLSW